MLVAIGVGAPGTSCPQFINLRLAWKKETRAGDWVEGPGLPQLILHLNCPKTSGLVSFPPLPPGFDQRGGEDQLCPD